MKKAFIYLQYTTESFNRDSRNLYYPLEKAKKEKYWMSGILTGQDSRNNEQMMNKLPVTEATQLSLFKNLCLLPFFSRDSNKLINSQFEVNVLTTVPK